jgi:hypothetical protein
VDSGIRHVQKHLAHVDIWTLGQQIEAVDDTSAFSALVHISNDDIMIKAYRDVA